MDQSTAGRAEPIPEDVARRLRDLESAVSPNEIADLWIFPPLADMETSREFLLFTRYLEHDRRRLYTARIPGHVAANGGEPPLPNGDGAGSAERRANGNAARDGEGGGHPRDRAQEIREHGTVPAERLPGLIQKFRRRVGDDREPLHVTIEGRLERWDELLPEDAANGDGTARSGSDG